MSTRLLVLCLGSALSLSIGACSSPQREDQPPSSGGRSGSGGSAATGAGRAGSPGTINTETAGGAGSSGSAGAAAGESGSGGSDSAGRGGGGGNGGSSSGQGGAGGNGATAGRGGSSGGSAGHAGAAGGGGASGASGQAGSSGGAGHSGNNPSVMHPPPISGGMSGWASRYWDCCKPACGWKQNVSRGNPMMSCGMSNQSLGGNYDEKNSCEGGDAFMCWSGAPWAADDTLAYGFAAASGGNYRCGRCYQLQFTGSSHNGSAAGAAMLSSKTMIVQVINNGGVGSDQFDLLIPGGGVGALNGCSKQWGSSVDLGTQYGGYLASCNGSTSCVQQKCQTVFGDKPDLLAGCNWFLGWFSAADNPNFMYKQIACPSEITQKSGLQDPG